MVLVRLPLCFALALRDKRQQLGVSYMSRVEDLVIVGDLCPCKPCTFYSLVLEQPLTGHSVICWGIAIQLWTFAIFMPFYLIVHLATSPTVSSRVAKNYAVDVPNLLSVPVSLVIGFVVPSVLLSLPAPSVLSFDQKQTFIAFWQMFPIWFECLQQLFSVVIAKFLPGTSKSPMSPQRANRRTMEALRSVYVFALAIAGVTHISMVMLSMTSILFPALFAPKFRGELDPSNVFLTKSFFASKPISSIGVGAFQLLQYDDMVGSIALQLWALALYVKTNKRISKVHRWTAMKVVSALIASTVLFGSCGCAVCFIWARDELVFAERDEDDRKSY